MYKKLTKQQQELVEYNHNLIYKFALKNKVAVDDYYDILAIGLCKAAIIFDESKGSFSTIAYRCMRNELYKHYKELSKKRAIPENVKVSYDQCVRDTEGDADLSCNYLEALSDSCSISDMVLSKITISQFIDMLSDTEKSIISLMVNGETQLEISRKMQCSKSLTNKRVQNIRNKITSILDVK